MQFAASGKKAGANKRKRRAWTSPKVVSTLSRVRLLGEFVSAIECLRGRCQACEQGIEEVWRRLSEGGERGDDSCLPSRYRRTKAAFCTQYVSEWNALKKDPNLIFSEWLPKPDPVAPA